MHLCFESSEIVETCWQRSALGIDANHDSADAEIVAQRLHPDGAEVTLCVNFRVCAVVVGV